MRPTGSRSAARSTATWSQRLLEAGEAYEAFSTAEEVEARHVAAGRNPKLGYDNFDRDLTDEQRAALRSPRAASRCVRLRMPDEDITWHDLVRGETTFAAGTVPDFALTRGSGDPLYTLVNPVDDALMKITHVLRGEDLLPSTPRQIALYQALMRIGVAERCRSSRICQAFSATATRSCPSAIPQSNLFLHRDRGFIPEGLLNYLALLGWGIADDRDVFSLDEMVAAFDVVDVNSNPARFDQKKADAINAEHIRLLSAGGLHRTAARRISPHTATTPASTTQQFAEAARLVQTRIVVLGDAWELLKFLNDDEFALDEKAAAKELRADAAPVLDAAVGALEAVGEWTTAEDRNSAQGGAVGESGAQAAQGVRADPGGGHRRVDQPAAVRIAGAARPRAQPGAGCARVGTATAAAADGVKRPSRIFGSLHVGPIQHAVASTHRLTGRKMACDLR